jgi:hypothetical protein
MTKIDKTASEQLAELEQQEADIAAKKEALLEAAKEEDLKLTKMLIARHGFLSRDLQPELKVRGPAAKAAAKKAARKTPSKK